MIPSRALVSLTPALVAAGTLPGGYERVLQDVRHDLTIVAAAREPH